MNFEISVLNRQRCEYHDSSSVYCLIYADNRFACYIASDLDENETDPEWSESEETKVVGRRRPRKRPRKSGDLRQQNESRDSTEDDSGDFGEKESDDRNVGFSEGNLLESMPWMLEGGDGDGAGFNPETTSVNEGESPRKSNVVPCRVTNVRGQVLWTNKNTVTY